MLPRFVITWEGDTYRIAGVRSNGDYSVLSRAGRPFTLSPATIKETR